MSASLPRRLRIQTPFPSRDFVFKALQTANGARPLRPNLKASQNTDSVPVYLSSSSALLPPSLEPLDLPPASFSASSFRTLFLANLSDLEHRLSKLDTLPSASWTEVLDEGATYVREGIAFLDWLSSEVGAHMPDFDFDFDLDIAISEMRSKLPDVKTHLADLEDGVWSRLKSVGESFGDARTKLRDLDMSLPTLPDPQDYAENLRLYLNTIHEHIQAVSIPSPTDLGLPSFPSSEKLTSLLPDLLGNAEEEIPPERLGERAMQLAHALKKSQDGSLLISYEDLPFQWKNNEFVCGGYRFIPLSKQTQLLLSAFKLHNETMNIHTHLIPLLSIAALALPALPSLASFLPIPFAESHPFHWQLNVFQSPALTDVDPFPRYLFWMAAAACLGCSTVWHLSSGCAEPWVLENGARIDYVGIGWLISASGSTVTYYGFADRPILRALYIGVNIATAGVAGSIVPFQAWFDERRNKLKRVAFFLLLATTTALPLAHLAVYKGFWEASYVLGLVGPSIAAYFMGIFFYTTHIPECLFPGRFDYFNSHALWHACIIIAIKLHWQAVEILHARAQSPLAV